MLIVQNYWISAISVPYIIMIRNKPQHAPSLVSLEKSKETNFCACIGEALKLPNYRKLVAIFALLQGGFLAFGTNMDQLFAPVGFTNADIAALGACVIVTGVVCSMIAGFILNKYHKYLWMIRCSAWGSFILVSAALGTF